MPTTPPVHPLCTTPPAPTVPTGGLGSHPDCRPPARSRRGLHARSGRLAATWRTRRGDHGSAAILGLFLTSLVLMTVVLVIDGGQHISATQQAHQIAAEAARAGGQAIQPSPVVRGEAPRADAAQASAAAQAFLAASGAAGRVQIIDGQRLQVTTRVPYRSVFGTLLQLPNVATGTADVRLVRGLDSEV